MNGHNNCKMSAFKSAFVQSNCHRLQSEYLKDASCLLPHLILLALHRLPMTLHSFPGPSKQCMHTSESLPLVFFCCFAPWGGLLRILDLRRMRSHQQQNKFRMSELIIHARAIETDNEHRSWHGALKEAAYLRRSNEGQPIDMCHKQS